MLVAIFCSQCVYFVVDCCLRMCNLVFVHYKSSIAHFKGTYGKKWARFSTGKDIEPFHTLQEAPLKEMDIHSMQGKVKTFLQQRNKNAVTRCYA